MKNNAWTYDKSIGKCFNDFSTYGMLSGWSTIGYMTYFTCSEDTSSFWHTKNVCYFSHWIWLPWDHKQHKEPKAFAGKTEFRSRPRDLSKDEILSKLNSVQFEERPRPVEQLNWMKNTIFFELEYWSKLKIRHIANTMDIKKNVCDNVVETTPSY